MFSPGGPASSNPGRDVVAPAVPDVPEDEPHQEPDVGHKSSRRRRRSAAEEDDRDRRDRRDRDRDRERDRDRDRAKGSSHRTHHT